MLCCGTTVNRGQPIQCLKIFRTWSACRYYIAADCKTRMEWGMNMNGKTTDRCISTEKDLGPFLRRFVLPAAVLCAIALGIVGIVWHSQETAPLTEAAAAGALRRWHEVVGRGPCALYIDRGGHLGNHFLRPGGRRAELADAIPEPGGGNAGIFFGGLEAVSVFRVDPL